MVRSTHYLRVIEQERLVENAAERGRQFLDGLRRLAADHPLISGVRGRGLMIAFDLPNRDRREEFYRGLFEVGVLAIRCGERSIRRHLEAGHHRSRPDGARPCGSSVCG
jgi:L-lysine 6-transaminase